MGKNNGKNMSKNLSGKYSPGTLAMRQKLFNNAKKSATDALKTLLKKVIQKAAEATIDLIGSKIANKITNVSKNSQQYNSEIDIIEHDKEIPKERYVFPEERQETINGLRLK